MFLVYCFFLLACHFLLVIFSVKSSLSNLKQYAEKLYEFSRAQTANILKTTIVIRLLNNSQLFSNIKRTKLKDKIKFGNLSWRRFYSSVFVFLRKKIQRIDQFNVPPGRIKFVLQQGVVKLSFPCGTPDTFFLTGKT